MYTVCLVLAPQEHIGDVRRLLCLIHDAPPDTMQLTVPLCPVDTVIEENSDPFDLATHWLGAYVPIQPDLLALFQSLQTTLPEPAGGWPWVVDDEPVLTFAQAQNAVAQMTFYSAFQEAADPQLGHTVLTALKGAKGLKGMDI